MSTAPTEVRPDPGAVVLVSRRGEDSERAKALVSRPFAEHLPRPEIWSEGPLVIAFAPGHERELRVTDRVVCLLEGALYQLPATDPASGAAPAPGADIPAAASGAEHLVRVYEQFGETVLEQVRGEFWALLWNRKRSEGFVMTDQIGSRAPYFSHDQGRTLVASEIRELLCCVSRRPEPDPLALAHWLMMTGPRAGTTLFSGVQSVKAGHLLRLSPGRYAAERYWTPRYQEPFRTPRVEQANALQHVLEQAVVRRLPPDAACGVLLSGGLDSSTVAALAAKHRPVHAYSAIFPDHRNMDESALIAQTAKQLAIDSTQIVVRSGSTVAGALAFTAAWQLPPISPNLFFWTPLLQRAAGDGVEVMLDGEGGDELFAFSPYLVGDLLLDGRIGRALRLARRWPGEAVPPSRELLWLRLRLAGAKAVMPAISHRLARRVRAVHRYAPPWLERSLAKRWLDTEDTAFAWKEIAGPRWWAYIVDLVTRGAGPSAVYEHSRRRSQLAGVRARHPLVDVDVIDLVLRLNPEFGFDRRFNRPMLREAIAGLVPEAVRLRQDKSNFDALFHQLLAGPDLFAVRKLLDPGRAQLRGYVDMDALYQELLASDPPVAARALAQWAIRVWRLLTAECWLRAEADAPGLEALVSELRLPPADHGFEIRRGADFRPRSC